MQENEKDSATRALGESPVNLAALAAIQPGCVVSREVLKKPAATVTVFAFDRGQGLSEHTAPFDAMVCVVDGEAEISISGKPQRVKKGEMVIMPANEPHAVRAVQKFKMMLIMIRS